MDQNLIEQLCAFPVVEEKGCQATKLKWKLQRHLQRNLMLKSQPCLTLDAVLTIFIQQCCQQSDKLAGQHLTAYLSRIAFAQSRKLHSKLETLSGSQYSLVDVFQIGNEIASQPGKFFQEYESNKYTVGVFANMRMETLIRDELFKSLGLKEKQRNLRKAKKYWVLKNLAGSKGKQLEEALAALGYKDSDLKRRLLAWKCFGKVYAPGKGEKHEPPTQEQLEKMADLYLFKSRDSDLKNDSFEVDINLISQWLEDCIKALYKNNSRYEVSLDAPLKNSDETGETLLTKIAGEQFHYGGDTTAINSYHNPDVDFENSLNEFSSKLNEKQYRLLILASGFELTTTAIAPLFERDQGTISRWLNAVKKEWLIEQLEKLGMNQRAAELRAGEALDRQTSKSINEVWKTRESHFSSLIYQQFERGWQQLEPPSPQLLELRFAKQQKPLQIAEQLRRDVAQVEAKMAEAVGNLEGVLLQWTEQKLEQSLATCEPLKKKIRELTAEWLELVFPQWVHESGVMSLEPSPTVSAVLSSWFERKFEQLWLPLEQILNLKWGWARSGSTSIKRGKILDFGYRGKVILAIAIQPEPDTDGETEVLVQVHPTGEESLPMGLKLRVELESDNDEVVAREGEQFVQLAFSESPGRIFRVKVFLEDAVTIEDFLV